MTLDGRRATLVALGVVAVALGASLFPAAGFGSTPGASPTAGTPAPATDGPSGASTASPTPATDRSSETTTAATREPTTALPQTATPTPTPETSTAPPSGADDDSSAFGTMTLFALVTAALVGAVAVTVVKFAAVGSGGAADGAGTARLLDRLRGVSLGRLVTRIPQATMAGIVGLSTGAARVVDTAGGVAGDVAAGLSVAIRAGSATGGDVLAGFGSVLSGGRGAGSSIASVPGVLARMASPFGGSDGRSGTRSVPSRRAGERTDERDDDEEPTPPETVEEAWAAVTDPLPVRNPEATTPGEYARIAVESGLPPEPVERLTAAFRAVRYGGQPRTPELTDGALAAAARIRDERGEGDG